MQFDISNPRWSGAGSIDVDWQHPEHGLIPYTAIDASGEPEMQAIWDGLMRGDYGTIQQEQNNG
ncbi:hypothetical protein [Paracoccus aminovorans]|uniref:hypothetical protein n=1 Tax=Paracoccus aminovorans TaxID=34004 RepID=UPI000780347E|nr:hypothetical protein [Paracoccus aminovorans]